MSTAAGHTKADEGGAASYRDLVRVPNLIRILCATFCARLASQSFSVVIVLFVLGVYHSPTLSGVVLLTSLVPGMLFSPFAGALLDRNAKIWLMTLDYSIGGASMITISVLSIAHLLAPWLLIVIVGCSSITQPLSRVGAKSIYPVIVPRPMWDHANAFDNGGLVLSSVFGPTIAGLAVALLGARWALVIPGGFLVLATLGIAWVSVDVPGTTKETTVFADGFAALSYVWNNRILRTLATTMSLYYVAQGSVSVAAPVLVLHRLHGGSRTVGLMFALMGTSAFLAGLTLGRIGTQGREKYVLAGACLTTGCGLAVLSEAHRIDTALVGMLILGLASGPLTVTMFSLRQRATDPSWFGRAFAVSMNLNYIGSPIGAAITGVVVSHSITAALLGAAALALTSGLGPALLSREHYATSFVPSPVTLEAELATN